MGLIFFVLGFNRKSHTGLTTTFAGQHLLDCGLPEGSDSSGACTCGFSTPQFLPPNGQRRAPGSRQLPGWSPRPLRRRARAEECGLAALEMNDDRGPLECPQSPHTLGLLCLFSLTGVTDGPGFHQPGPSTLSLPAESEIFSGI